MNVAATFWSVALRRSVVMRAAKTALVVGTLLILINQGDSLLAGVITPAHVAKMLLTFAVPYCVATYSSVGAILDSSRDTPDTV